MNPAAVTAVAINWLRKSLTVPVLMLAVPPSRARSFSILLGVVLRKGAKEMNHQRFQTRKGEARVDVETMRRKTACFTTAISWIFLLHQYPPLMLWGVTVQVQGEKLSLSQTMNLFHLLVHVLHPLPFYSTQSRFQSMFPTVNPPSCTQGAEEVVGHCPHQHFSSKVESGDARSRFLNIKPAD